MIRHALAAVLVAVALSEAASARTSPSQDQAPSQGTASIAGRVVAGHTGRPVAGATVLLGSRELLRAPRTTKTDAQGRFEFAELVAGSYSLSARSARFLQTFYGQTPSRDRGSPIALRDGERFGRADVSLNKPGAIEGRAFDEFGEPAPDIVVTAYRLQFVAGARRLVAVGGPQADPTDDKGQFRFFGLEPGTYYLCAQCGASAEENNAGGFAPTYFPGIVDASRSRGLTVTLASDRTGVAIQLVPGRTGRISGSVVHEYGLALQGGMVRLTVQDPSGLSPFAANATVGRDGRFAFLNVPAGAYHLQAAGRSGSGTGAAGQLAFGSLVTTTTGDDAEGVVVIVRPGVTASGRVEFDGDDVPLPRIEDVVVFAQPAGPDASSNSGVFSQTPAQVREDWTFEMRDLSGWGILRPLFRQSSAWALSRVTLDGVDVTDTPMEFTREDIGGVEILLTSRAGAVRGTVVSAAGEPVRDYAVVVFAVDRARWVYPSRYMALARPDPEGRFEAKGLPPEDYLVIAVPSITGSGWQDPEFLERLRVDATRLLLTEGQSRAIELRLSATPEIR